jgi:hypothetical protein
MIRVGALQRETKHNVRSPESIRCSFMTQIHIKVKFCRSGGEAWVWIGIDLGHHCYISLISCCMRLSNHCKSLGLCSLSRYSEVSLSGHVVFYPSP